MFAVVGIVLMIFGIYKADALWVIAGALVMQLTISIKKAKDDNEFRHGILDILIKAVKEVNDREK